MTSPLGTRREGPPALFEVLLVRAGRHTRVGAGAVDDLRREHSRWRSEGRAANARYAVAATALAVRLFIEGRRSRGQMDRARSEPGATLHDIRYGLRGLLRAPVFTLMAGTTFAVGVGATTAIFAIAHTVLLKPLPYPDPHELQVIEVNTGGPGWYGSSEPEYLDYQDQLAAFEGVAAYRIGEVTMGDSLSPVRVRAALVSASLLPVLGVEPMIGRFFGADEETSANNRYVVLSHGMWQQAYGGARDLVGTTIPLFGVDYLVLGVMPPGFAFPDADVRAWFPYGMNRANPSPRNNHMLSVVARLRDGENAERAAAQLEAYTARAREEYPEIYSERGFRVRLRPFHESVVGEVRTPLVVLLGAVGLVLLIACVNVANLILTRAGSRRRELAVRAALGASQGRLIRQLATESMLLSTLGGVAGVGLALILIRMIVGWAPASIPRLDEVSIGAVPLLVAVLTIASAGLAFGMLPARSATRHVRDGSLARAGRGTVTRLSVVRLRRWLVASQVALAAIVTLGSGLMLRTLHNLRSIDPGFTAGNVLTLAVSPAAQRYAEPERRAAFWTELNERFAALPGVTGVGATSALPLSDQFDFLSIRVEGRVTTSIGDAPDARLQRVTPGLLEAMQIPLVRGRLFTDADRADATPVVIVSRSFAERFWPGEEPIGKQMKVFAERYPWLEVVGVVEDIPYDRLEGTREPMWYVPHAQAQNAYGTPLRMFAVLRTRAAPTEMLPAVREVLRDMDATVPISQAKLLQDVVDESIAGRTFTFDLLRSFCLVAIFLAGIGVYGVMMLSVGERTAEIALRRALGAGRGSIFSLVARENLVTVGLGAAAGLFVGLGVSRFLTGMLFGVGGVDAWALGATAAMLLATAVFASLIPLRRALGIEPVSSLHGEV
jgi:putative ABC transport system permease protein